MLAAKSPAAMANAASHATHKNMRRVRVDGYTYGENESGKTRQRQHGVESGKRSESEQHVEAEPKHRENAGKAVVAEHDGDDEDDCDDSRRDPL